MASFSKKYATLAPTVRTLASGTPSAPSVNLAARAVASGHGHGHGPGPRSDAPSKWAGGYRSTSSGVFNKSYITGTHGATPSEMYYTADRVVFNVRIQHLPLASSNLVYSTLLPSAEMRTKFPTSRSTLPPPNPITVPSHTS